jgi:hypothetical protein
VLLEQENQISVPLTITGILVISWDHLAENNLAALAYRCRLNCPVKKRVFFG